MIRVLHSGRHLAGAEDRQVVYWAVAVAEGVDVDVDVDEGCGDGLLSTCEGG